MFIEDENSFSCLCALNCDFYNYYDQYVPDVCHLKS